MGKINTLTPKEIESFLKRYNIFFANSFNSNLDIGFMVVSTMLKPLEEEIANNLYLKGIKEVKLKDFEEFYAKNINKNSLLMSIKLSNNQEKIKRLLKIESFDDEFYLKLFNLYDWQNEGVFDNDSNRDVTISFLKRFFKAPKNFNHNQINHTPNSLIEIALTSTNISVLNALLNMPNYQIKTRGKEEWKPKNLKEFIAANFNIDKKIIKYLLSLNDNRIDTILAINPKLCKDFQKIILNRASKVTLINLSKNPNLDIEIFKKLLNSEVKEILLLNQIITKEKFKFIKQKDYLILAKNPNIKEIIDNLLFINKDLDFALASNLSLSGKNIIELFKKYKDKIELFIAKNPNTPKEILKEIFKKNNFNLNLQLAQNKNTPKEILDTLCKENNPILNKELAKNPNLSDEYIEYFKLDSELLRIMSQNEILVKKISQKKEYL